MKYQTAVEKPDQPGPEKISKNNFLTGAPDQEKKRDKYKFVPFQRGF